MLSCDNYVVPKSLDELFDFMEANAGCYRLVAGATDLLPWAREGHGGDVHCSIIIDLSQVEELTGSVPNDDCISIGANTTIQQFLADPVLQKLPLLSKSAIWFADQQIREQATIGGNIVNASPCADMVPPVIALGGTLTLVSRDGGQLVTRIVPAEEFILASGKTVMAEGEILTRVDCVTASDYGCSFKKVGSRRSLVISVANAAVLVKADEQNHKFEDVRIVIGGVAPTPCRLKKVEQALIGQPLSMESVESAAERIPGTVVGSRSRIEYRREVVRNFVVSGVVEALIDAGVSLTEEVCCA